ncbi:MarR family winged helix-turn-helix transcriptional regulator [Actinocorallia populi]|uniref:MarR family winged helix-turn-helix transcriptional regulator n=1 Tax=Actinocorallia populi TaxID=2079200 RepID=UPI000D0973A4|nr:MarR family transcriptional regulator [Actinocorallia populi]
MQTSADDSVPSRIGSSLLRLRRVWARPDLVRKVGEQTPGSRPLQLSNLMVVTAVGRLGACGGEVTVGAVAERLEIDPSTASRLVGHAIDAGFVTRRPSTSDARRADLQLTETGLRVLESADEHRNAYVSRVMRTWPEADRREFARLLTAFTEGVCAEPLDSGDLCEIFSRVEDSR